MKNNFQQLVKGSLGIKERNKERQCQLHCWRCENYYRVTGSIKTFPKCCCCFKRLILRKGKRLRHKVAALMEGSCSRNIFHVKIVIVIHCK